ncbi:phage tail protein [Pseudomonas protegens]|uniref:phage tail protein n=1 Tax=Pseudomonas protegens TaxID=380021 RepID=UPI000F4B890E|nr:phage tail protein [Pseudomonas protegens]
MTDQNSQFFAILTAVGKAKQANADALGVPWTFAQMGVGDANNTEPMPSEQQTRLINERRRAPLNQLKVDPNNPNIIIAEQVIPESVGGWWIREIGLYDTAGDLVAVANCAPSFKPLLSQGSGRTQVVRMNLIVSNTANVELKIDPSIVLATRSYVDAKVLEEIYKLDSKQSVRVATTANIALAGLQTVDGVALVTGDRVLVKNQTVPKDNGLYSAAAGPWTRTADADTSAKVTSALIVSVEQGTTQADSRWQLITDDAIVLDSTPLVFQNMTQGLAPISSPAFLGTPTAPTSPQFDNSSRLATNEFVQRALGNFAGQYSATSTQTLTLAQAGLIINAGNTITLTLPTATALNIGATYQINNAGTGEVTVRASTDQFLYGIGNGTPRTFVLRSGDTVTISYVGGKSWYAWGGVQLGASASFAAVFSAGGYQVLPSGELEQSGTITLGPIGNFNAQVLGGVTYYTTYYQVTYPLAFTAGPYTANVTLACAPFTVQGGMAGCHATCSMNGGGSPLTRLDIAVTNPTLGFTPTVHWKVRGKI